MQKMAKCSGTASVDVPVVGVRKDRSASVGCHRRNGRGGH